MIVSDLIGSAMMLAQGCQDKITLVHRRGWAGKLYFIAEGSVHLNLGADNAAQVRGDTIR